MPRNKNKSRNEFSTVFSGKPSEVHNDTFVNFQNFKHLVIFVLMLRPNIKIKKVRLRRLVLGSIKVVKKRNKIIKKKSKKTNKTK